MEVGLPDIETKFQLIEGDVGACLSNPYQLLDLIHHKLVELLGSSDFHHGEYVAGAPTRVGHLDSREPRDLPSNVARRARFRCNDDIGSHDRPSKLPCRWF